MISIIIYRERAIYQLTFFFFFFGMSYTNSFSSIIKTKDIKGWQNEFTCRVRVNLVNQPTYLCQPKHDTLIKRVIKGLLIYDMNPFNINPNPKTTYRVCVGFTNCGLNC